MNNDLKELEGELWDARQALVKAKDFVEKSERQVRELIEKEQEAKLPKYYLKCKQCKNEIVELDEKTAEFINEHNMGFTAKTQTSKRDFS